ncbi:hypothetical protein Tco_0614641 [Tanacetum coccineum]
MDTKGFCIQTGEEICQGWESTVHKDKAFDELDDEIDNMETEDAQEMGRTRYVVHEEKERKEKEDSDQTEGRSATPTTPTPTPTTFGDDETIAQVLIIMGQNKKKLKEKKKEVVALRIRDESDTESEGIPEAEKKFKQLARDEEMARKYDFIQARIEADRLLALRLQDEERESKTPNKDDTTEVPTKQDVADQGTKKRKGGHIKMIARKKLRKKSNVDSEDEHRKCLKIVTFEGAIDFSDIMEETSYYIQVEQGIITDGDYLVIYRANGNFRAFNYYIGDVAAKTCCYPTDADCNSPDNTVSALICLILCSSLCADL